MLDDPHVPKDLVIIGHLIGYGEVICFSRITGEIVRYFSRKCEKYNNFKPILHQIIRMMRGESSISKKSEDLLRVMFEARKLKNIKGE